jgi:hypothetical protein
VAGSCEYGAERSGSGATDLVSCESCMKAIRPGALLTAIKIL